MLALNLMFVDIVYVLSYMPRKYVNILNDDPIRNVLHSMPKSYNNSAYDLHVSLN